MARVVAATLAVVLIALIAVVWRLNSGPVSLEFARTRILEAIQPQDGSIRLDIGTPVLTWQGWNRLFDITIADLHLSTDDGSFSLSAPETLLRLSIRSFLNDAIIPQRITINAPVVQLPDIATLNINGEPDEPGALLSGLNLISAVEQLQRLELRKARILAVAPLAGGIETIQDLDLDVSRSLSGLNIAGEGDAVSGGSRSHFTSAMHYEIETNRLSGTFSVADLPYAAISGLLSDAAVIDGQISADAAFELSLPDRLISARINLASNDAVVRITDIYQAGLPYDRLEVEAAYSDIDDRIEIRQLKIRTLDSTITASASIAASTSAPFVTIAAAIDRLAVNDLERYWPANLAPGAREWVTENLEDGIIREISLDLEGRTAAADMSSLAVTSATGAFAVDGVTAHYFRPMPPVTAAAGRASFDENSISIDVLQGTHGDIAIGKSRIVLSAFNAPVQRADIEVDLTGPTGSIVALLRHDATKLRDLIDYAPEAVGGQVTANIRFGFPLLKSLTLGELELGADVQMQELSIRDAAFGLPLTNGEFEARLMPGTATFEGSGLFDGRPARYQRQEFFSESSVQSRRHKLIAELDSSILTNQLPSGMLSASGVVQIDSDIVELRDNRITINAAVNIEKNEIDIPFFQWQKKSGTPGMVKLDLSLRDGEIDEINSVTLDSENLAIDASAYFSPDSEFPEQIILNELKFFDSSMAGKIDYNLATGIVADLVGARLDTRIFAGDQNEERTPTEYEAVQLNASFEQIDIEFLPPVKRSVINLDRSDVGESVFRLAGYVGDKPLTVDYRGRPGETGNFRINAESAEAALRQISVLDTIRGGALDIAGTRAGSGENTVTRMNVSIQDFVVVDTPILAQLLHLVYLPGLIATLGSPRRDSISKTRCRHHCNARQDRDHQGSGARLFSRNIRKRFPRYRRRYGGFGRADYSRLPDQSIDQESAGDRQNSHRRRNSWSGCRLVYHTRIARRS